MAQLSECVSETTPLPAHLTTLTGVRTSRSPGRLCLQPARTGTAAQYCSPGACICAVLSRAMPSHVPNIDSWTPESQPLRESSILDKYRCLLEALHDLRCACSRRPHACNINCTGQQRPTSPHTCVPEQAKDGQCDLHAQARAALWGECAPSDAAMHGAVRAAARTGGGGDCMRPRAARPWRPPNSPPPQSSWRARSHVGGTTRTPQRRGHTPAQRRCSMYDRVRARRVVATAGQMIAGLSHVQGLSMWAQFGIGEIKQGDRKWARASTTTNVS